MKSRRLTWIGCWICLVSALMLAGCGTRVWGEGGGGQRPWGGISVPLGSADGK